MRCLTLADEVRARGACTYFVAVDLERSLEELIRGRGHSVVRIAPLDSRQDARLTLESAPERDCVVMDDYHLGEEWELQARLAGARVVMRIDDLANRACACDLLLDQNYFDCPIERYSSLLGHPCRLMLGPKYALVQESFLRARARRRTGTCQRILVYMGGGFVGQSTLAMVQIVREALPDVSVDVVLGHAASAGELAEEIVSMTDVRLHTRTADMPALVEAADLFVGGAGGSTWERLCAGLPSLVVTTAENQRAPIEALATVGAVVDCGDWRESDHDQLVVIVRDLVGDGQKLLRLSECGKRVVDGRGAKRCADALLALDDGPASVNLVRLGLEHSSATYSWLQDGQLRRDFLMSGEVTREGNLTYFGESLADSSRRDYAIQVGSTHVGNAGVRDIDFESRTGEMWLFLCRDARGRGIGMAAGSALIDDAIRCLRLEKLSLHVGDFNEAAINMYTRLGFVFVSDVSHTAPWDGREYRVFEFELEATKWMSQ